VDDKGVIGVRGAVPREIAEWASKPHAASRWGCYLSATSPPPANPEPVRAVIRLTRRVRFSAAHRYHRPEWSEEQNRRTFGPCANPHGHGHNYLLEVSVEGAIDPLTGYSVDLGALDELLRREVLVPLDHQHLNHAVPAFAPGALIPTTENIVAWIWERIEPHLPEGVRLVSLRLHENEEFFVDYAGPDRA
jgi:6-pyruvoyltetrahydropterin/6-carboxytetrahydropterin synthase